MALRNGGALLGGAPQPCGAAFAMRLGAMGDLLHNVDVARLCAPADAGLRAACAHRGVAVQAACLKAVFIAKAVKRGLAHTKTTRSLSIAVVGGRGSVCHALSTALVERGVVEPQQLVLVHRGSMYEPGSEGGCEGEKLGGAPAGCLRLSSIQDAVTTQQVRIIFLACGPEHLEKAASELRPVLKPTIVVVSLLAGVTMAKLAQVLQVPHPVRAVHTRPAVGIAPVCAETFLRHSKRPPPDFLSHGSGAGADAVGAGGTGASAETRGAGVGGAPGAPGVWALQALDEAADDLFADPDCTLDELVKAIYQQATSLGVARERATLLASRVVWGYEATPKHDQHLRPASATQAPQVRHEEESKLESSTASESSKTSKSGTAILASRPISDQSHLHSPSPGSPGGQNPGQQHGKQQHHNSHSHSQVARKTTREEFISYFRTHVA
jgi:hypothetical protein